MAGMTRAENWAWLWWTILGLVVVVAVVANMAGNSPAPRAADAPTGERGTAVVDSVLKAERPAELRATPWHWREDGDDRYGDKGAIRRGGVAWTIATSREAGGPWQDRRLSLSCGWEGEDGSGPMYSLKFHYPGVQKIEDGDGRGATSIRASVDGLLLPPGKQNSFGAAGNAYTFDGYAKTDVPLGVRGPLMAGDTVRVEHVDAAGNVLDVGTFALRGSAAALSDAGLGACSWAKAEQLRAKADRRDADRLAAEQARRKRLANPCTSGARFEKIFLVGWLYQPSPGADWVSVRDLFPDDYNKITRQLEWLGAGDPVLYKDIPGLC